MMGGGCVVVVGVLRWRFIGYPDNVRFWGLFSVFPPLEAD